MIRVSIHGIIFLVPFAWWYKNHFFEKIAILTWSTFLYFFIFQHFFILRSSRPDVFCKKVFEIKVCNVIKIETLAQVFSCEFCEVSKKTFSYRTPPVAASVCYCWAEQKFQNVRHSVLPTPHLISNKSLTQYLL